MENFSIVYYVVTEVRACRACSEWGPGLGRDPRTATRQSPRSPLWLTTGAGPRRPRSSRQSPVAPAASPRDRGRDTGRPQEMETETGDLWTVPWCPSQTWCSTARLVTEKTAAAIPRAPRLCTAGGTFTKYDENISSLPPVWKQNSEKEITFSF